MTNTGEETVWIRVRNKPTRSLLSLRASVACSPLCVCVCGTCSSQLWHLSCPVLQPCSQQMSSCSRRSCSALTEADNWEPEASERSDNQRAAMFGQCFICFLTETPHLRPAAEAGSPRGGGGSVSDAAALKDLTCLLTVLITCDDAVMLWMY